MLVSALMTARTDSVSAAALHPMAACPIPGRPVSEVAWVWHTFRDAAYRILQPAEMKWGQNYRGVENWVQAMTDTAPVPPNAYEIDVVATPASDVPAAGPERPYRLICHVDVAGRPANVIIDTLSMAPDLGPAHIRAYNAYAYIGIGRDRVLRVRASIFNDTTLPYPTLPYPTLPYRVSSSGFSRISVPRTPRASNMCSRLSALDSVHRNAKVTLRRYIAWRRTPPHSMGPDYDSRPSASDLRLRRGLQ
jgi:hypothetical protein